MHLCTCTYIPREPIKFTYVIYAHIRTHIQVEKPFMKLQKLFFEGPSSGDKRRAAQLAARQGGGVGRVELVAASKGAAM